MTLAFQQTQRKFVSAIRTGNSGEGDGDFDRRMKIYQSLLFNNVLNFVDNGFPVLKSIIADEQWQRLVRHFFQTWHCKSPYFVDISSAFVSFLNDIDLQEHQLPAFAYSLAHYEWLELAVSIRDKAVTFNKYGVVTNKVQFSPLASLVSYPFPVHQITKLNQPQEPSEPHHYVVYRDINDEVQFSKLAPATAYLLHLLIESDEGLSRQLIKDSAIKAMPNLSPATIEAGLDVTIDDMLDKGILIPA